MGRVKQLLRRILHRQKVPVTEGPKLSPPQDLFVLTPSSQRAVPGVSGLSINPTLPGPTIPLPQAHGATGARQVPPSGTAARPMLADTLDQNVAVRPWYARATQTAAAPHVVAIAQAQAGNQPGGVGGTVTIPLGSSDLGLGGLADAASGAGTITHTVGNMSLAGGAVVGDGFASLSGGAVVATGPALQVANVAVFGWADYLGVAGSWAMVNPSTQQFLLVGASGAVSANRTARYLGQYTRPDASSVAAAHHISGDLHRLQFVWRRGAAASLRAGGGHFLFGGQIRLGYSRAKDITYTCFANTRAARKSIFEGHGFRHFMGSKLRALGWRRDPWAPPPITQPDKLGLGDEVRLSTSGSWIAGGVAGNLGAWVGAQYVYKGDVELVVRKVSAHHVELVTTPLKLHSVAALAGSAIGLQATLERPTAHALRQAFLFDLRKPSGVAAYRAAIAGKVPGALHRANIVTA